MRSAILVVLGGLLLHAGAQPTRAGTPETPLPVDGTWCAVLSARDMGLTTRPLPTFPLSAAVTLKPAGEARPDWARELGMTHVGAWSGELRAIGVGRSPGRRGTPPAGARADAPNVVTVTLNPAQDHEVLTMRGRMEGDTIKGTWSVTSYARGASGTFRMQRTPAGNDGCA